MPLPRPEIPAAPLVLFVCSGNICRSPMAEALLRHALPAGSRWRTASAGLGAMDGLPASPEAVLAAAETGARLEDHVSRMLSDGLADGARVIVALTREHRAQIVVRDPASAQKTFVLKSFDPAAEGTDPDVADPIGGDLARYRRCRDEIGRCLPGLLEFLDGLE